MGNNRHHFGASTWLWHSPLTTDAAERLLPHVAGLGFDCVELPLEKVEDLDPSRIRVLLRDYGLTPTVCGAFGPGRDLTHPDSAVRSSTLDYIKKALDFAAEVGASALCGPLYSQVGKRRPLAATQRTAEWSLAVEGVRRCCEEAGGRGLRIAIEPINRFETDLINTVEQAVRLARDTQHPAAGVMVDSFHLTIEEADLERAILAAGDRLLHVQVSENHRGVPGTGLTDWVAFRRGVEAANYRGPIVIESFTPENEALAGAVCIWNRQTPDQDTFAREGLIFLRQLFNSPS